MKVVLAQIRADGYEAAYEGAEANTLPSNTAIPVTHTFVVDHQMVLFLWPDPELPDAVPAYIIRPRTDAEPTGEQAAQAWWVRERITEG